MFIGKKKKGVSKVDTSSSADSSLLDLQEVKRDMDKALDILKQEYIKSLNIRTSQGKWAMERIKTSLWAICR